MYQVIVPRRMLEKWQEINTCFKEFISAERENGSLVLRCIWKYTASEIWFLWVRLKS